MLPKWHILIGVTISFIIYWLASITLWQVALIFLTSVFIDFDHYFRYICITKNMNPFKFWNWSKLRTKKWCKLKNKENYKKPFYLFHGIEFLIFLLILSLFWKSAIFLFIGALLHLSCDYIDLILNHDNLYSKISFIWVLIKNKNLNNPGF